MNINFNLTYFAAIKYSFAQADVRSIAEN